MESQEIKISETKNNLNPKILRNISIFFKKVWDALWEAVDWIWNALSTEINYKLWKWFQDDAKNLAWDWKNIWNDLKMKFKRNGQTHSFIFYSSSLTAIWSSSSCSISISAGAFIIMSWAFPDFGKA